MNNILDPQFTSITYPYAMKRSDPQMSYVTANTTSTKPPIEFLQARVKELEAELKETENNLNYYRNE